MTILEWVKANAKDGSNIAEAEELIERSNPLSKVKSKESALAFMIENPDFKSALDSRIREAVESNSTKFAETKLPGLLKEEREKVMKELNPEETPESKRIRELEEKLSASDKRDAEKTLKSELRKRADEYKIPGELAETYAPHGDAAFDQLERASTFINKTIEERVAEEIKVRFKGRAPEAGNPPKGKQMARAEFDSLGASEKSAFIGDGGSVAD